MVQDIHSKADNHSDYQTISSFLYGTRRFITVLKKASLYCAYSSAHNFSRLNYM